MNRKIRVHYPWKNTPPQSGFFVPTLKLEETRQDGLKAALHYRIFGKAEFGTKDGKLGVFFIRVR
jgi:hypothetical protein